ncbi:MMPL family transporter [Rhodoferax sp.]|uniref:MMPL family transporter n=1 Tax=Rhodoferax sp. TaxID=50421 RepID=UPI00374D8FEF
MNKLPSARMPAVWHVLALLWLVMAALVAGHQWQFWHTASLDSDVLALLPQDEHAPEVSAATRRLAEQTSRQVVVVLGGKDWEQVRAAAAAHRAAVAAAPGGLKPLAGLDAAGLAQVLDFYRPYRDRLLTDAQRRQLSDSPPAELLQTALGALYQPGVSLKLSAWVSDPLALWPQWWAQRAGESRARLRDGWPWFSAEGMDWVVLVYELPGPAFAMDGSTPVTNTLAQAAAAIQLPGLRVVSTGIALHAEAAAAQANREVNTIGWGSLAAVLLLVWLAFRSLRPIVLVSLSLLLGCATALTVTALVFGKVHLLTLVFGSSLVGVAEDFGIHYFATRQSRPGQTRWTVMGELLPGLALALTTSVLAYLVLGLAPFPGLRQIAVFSSVGLLAAFLTVVCWFPWMDRGAVPLSRFAQRIALSLDSVPVLRARPIMWVLSLAVAVFLALGMARLQNNDDIRQLQGSPKALIDAQRELGRLLALPSPAQFYLVRGQNAEQVLQREETLKQALGLLAAQGVVGGWRAVSDWVPSQARQQADAALTARAEAAVLAGVAQQLDETFTRPAFAPQPLGVDQWLAHPASAVARALWLGEVNGQISSVVMLQGVSGPTALPRLAQLADGVQGVRWVDTTANVSSLLGRYRVSMLALLAGGYAVVFLALFWRYRGDAWRAWVPTLLASALSVAIQGFVGMPFQLFNVLALVLLLGMGVDYGIFLLEHRGDRSAWLAIVLGAASTLLSFGLLALSSTPALQAFGFTMACGVTLVWGLSPFFRPLESSPP